MNYLAILGRQPEISLAELEALFKDVKKISPNLATFSHDSTPDINRLGGTLKLAEKLSQKPLEHLSSLEEGKITIGLSDYSKSVSPKSVREEALKLKKILVRHGRSVRVVESKDAFLSTATSLHNGLGGKNLRKIELIKHDSDWYRVIGVQDIDSYAHRDQTRPFRDAKVGMLPPKLAQILINLCGPLPKDSVVLDPFCGTGVLLQEALLMGYHAYGTDIDERMVKYSEKNLNWLLKDASFELSEGDATSFRWKQPINAVACEGYLGKPLTKIPSEIELKEQKQACKTVIAGFLKNLQGQIKSGTPVVIASPAWLREDHTFSRLLTIDEITDLGYNVNNKTHKGLLYYREKQIVARDILILRKK